MNITPEQLKQIIVDSEPGSNHTFYFVSKCEDETILADLRIIADKLNAFSKSESRWLIEFVGAIPCPVYATDGPWPTCDPWAAKWFDTEDEAKSWMIRPGIVGYEFPWKPVSHSFVRGE